MATAASKLAFTETGRRGTRQRRVIREYLEQSDTFVSAQQVHEALALSGEKVGLATVYRTLQAMVNAAEVDLVRTNSGEALYRKCGTRHHHHLTCRKCGLAVELEGPSVERWAQRVAAENGFTDPSHVVELFGICANCGT
ncbi:MAG TPA: transcriptional repressor [Actinobacteria bacterium]|jgi:Fur family ferric uptake transcriptional regulator|nr:transcriptional repressor [Actinomycetota bacterium]